MVAFTLKINGKSIVFTTLSLRSEPFSWPQGKQRISSPWVYAFKLSHLSNKRTGHENNSGHKPGVPALSRIHWIKVKLTLSTLSE